MLPIALTLAALSFQLPHELGLRLGGAPDELFAVTTRLAGDVDADGYGDVLVYSVKNSGTLEAVVTAHSGRDGSLLHSFPKLAIVVFSGLPGVCMDGAGDANGDGYDDVIVGDPARASAEVYSGSDGSILHHFAGESALDGFGGAVAGVGDVNGDGFGDVMVGTTTADVGYARVYSGADGSQLHGFRGKDLGDRFGGPVSAVGDVDGDGFVDFGVGALGEGLSYLHPGFPPFLPPFRTDDNSGGVSVFSGRDGAELYTVLGTASEDGFGYSIDGVGDVNGDGFDDFAAGSLSVEDVSTPGYARLVSGLDGSTLFTWSGDSHAASRMITVSGAGDVDGDSVPDVMVGGVSNAPAARIYSGANGSPLFRLDAGNPFPPGNVSVDGGSDVDGDGIADFLIGIGVPVFGTGYFKLFVSGG